MSCFFKYFFQEKIFLIFFKRKYEEVANLVLRPKMRPSPSGSQNLSLQEKEIWPHSHSPYTKLTKVHDTLLLFHLPLCLKLSNFPIRKGICASPLKIVKYARNNQIRHLRGNRKRVKHYSKKNTL